MITKIYIDQYEILELGYGLLELDTNESMDLLNNTLQLPTAKFTIHDVDLAFSPQSPSGIFYNQDFKKFKVKFHNEFDEVVYQGNILNIKTDPRTKQVEFELENGVQKLFEETIQYVADVIDNKTPADIAYDVLIQIGLKDYIDQASFQHAINYQHSVGYIVSATYTAEQKTTVGEAIENLAYIGGCDLYFSNNRIVLNQYIYANNTNIPTHIFGENEIFGEFNLSYNNNFQKNQFIVDVKGSGDTINQIFDDTGYNNVGLTSRNKYGTLELKKIDLNIDTSSVYSNVTSNTVIAAIMVAENYIRRFQEQLLQVQFSYITDQQRRFKLGEKITLDIIESHYILDNNNYKIISLGTSENSNMTEVVAIQHITS